VEDRIDLALGGAPELLDAARTHTDYIAAETLVLSLTIGADETSALDYAEQAEIEGLALEIALSRATSP
jgi:hypothetical protein